MVFSITHPGDDYEPSWPAWGRTPESGFFGYIDPKKLAGDWCAAEEAFHRLEITHTDRFSRPPSHAARHLQLGLVVVYANFTLFQHTWLGAAPFEDPQDYAHLPP